jgi:outer membrane protein
MLNTERVSLIYWTEELKTKTMHKFIPFLLCLFVFKGIAQDSTLYTLTQCIDIALKNNLDVRTAELQEELANARLQQARASALPYANAYASQGINKGKSINPYTNTFVNQEIITGQYGVNGGIVLFNGFNIVNTMRQNYFSHEAGKMDREQAKMDITINVMLAYLQILNNQSLLIQAASQVRVSESQVKRLSILETNNAASPPVLYDTKGQLANDKLMYITSQSNLVSSKIALERLLNLPLPATAKFEALDLSHELKPYEATPEAVYSNASASMPLIKSAELRRMSAVKNVHALRGQLFPTLSLTGSLGTNYSDAALAQKIIGVSNEGTDSYVMVNNNPVPVFSPQYQYQSDKISFSDQFQNNLNSYVGLSLNIPVFNGLRTKTQLSIAKINKWQAEAQQAATTNRLKNNIQQAYNDMSVSYERYLVLEQQVKDYIESFKIATVKFEKGAITTVDYLIAKTNIDRANINFISSKYEYILKTKVLDYYMGKGNK